MLSLPAVTGRRRATVAKVLVTAVTAVVAVGGFTSASAAPGTAAAGQAAPADVPAQQPHPGLPGISNSGVDSGALLNGIASVPKAKITVELPLQVQRAYASNTFEQLPKGCKGAACKTLVTYTPVWSITDPGPSPSFGGFPETWVTVLGFGALPVRVKLHLDQLPDDDGLLEPLLVTAQGPLAASTSTTEITGRLAVRLSDVTVDGVPLDVGPHCGTVSPATLDLHGQYTGPAKGGGIKPGDYDVFQGGRVSGEVVIPPFSGCGVGGQDLDPLFTGTVSGSGNTLTLNQSALGTYDPTVPNDCSLTTAGGVKRECPAPPKIPLPK